MERNPARLLLREARERRIGLVVPQIAFDEAVNLYRERVEEHIRLRRAAVEFAAIDRSPWSRLR